MKKDREKKDIYTRIILILEIVLLIIMITMIFKLGSYIMEHIESERYAKELQESVLVIEPETEIELTKKESNFAEEELESTEEKHKPIEKESESTEKKEETKIEKNIIIPKAINFESLKSITNDAVAWIYDPGMIINYVIAQSQDNSYYLYRQLNGVDNKNGTIFMDCRNSSDFSDWNTIIHGHNMKSGAMFGTLMNYRNAGYYEEHPVMYIYVPNQRYKLELIAGYTTTSSDSLYQLPSDKEKQQEILNTAYKLSTFESNIRPQEDDKLVTLSTCSYAYDDARYVVIGRLVAE